MIWLVVAMMGCRPAMTFRVTRPAEIAVDQSIQKLAVIDRAGSPASQATSSAFVDELLALSSPRFTAVSRQASRRAFSAVTVTEGDTIRPAQAGAMCKDLNVTGIVSLEHMQVSDDWFFDTRIEEETTTVTVNGRAREETREVIVHEATYTAEIATTWRLYSCQGRVRDFYQTVVHSSFYGEGDTRADARNDVGETDDLQADLSVTAAWVYLKRISPYDMDVSRTYYRGWGGDLRQGAKAMRAGNFGVAEKALKRSIRAKGGKTKGKALYDLAIVSEQNGDLARALNQARRANKILDSTLSNELVRRLRARKRQDSEIKEQLDTPPAAVPVLVPVPEPGAPNMVPVER